MTTIEHISLDRKRTLGVHKCVDENGIVYGQEERFETSREQGFTEISHSGTPIGSLVETKIEAKANKEKRILDQKEKARDYIRSLYRYISPALG